MQTEFDVVIVGAGPAGSSAAILLARAGWSVALVEKICFPRRKVCGECIAASNLPLLDALGIGDAFDLAAGPELRKVAMMCGEREVEADLPMAAHDKYPWGRALGREKLDTLLLSRARSAGAVVLQPGSVRAIDGAIGDWHCGVRMRDSSAAMGLHAPVVIDAHGSWEAMSSDRALRPAAHKGSDLLAFKANFRGSSLREGLLPVLAFEGGYGGMVVADDGVTTVACCVRRDRLGDLRGDSPGLRAGPAVEALLKRECAGVRSALESASRDGPWLAAGPIAPGIRLRAEDDVLRIGNAAGEAHPIIGEGMSMALQSAWILSALLLDARRSASLSDQRWQREVGRRYAAQWRREFEPRMRLAAAFAHLAMRPGGAALLLALARTWPKLVTFGAKSAGKVRCAADPDTFDQFRTHTASVAVSPSSVVGVPPMASRVD